jgi:hypothetical protein
MAAERVVSSIKDWQSTDRALYDDDGKLWMPSQDMYKRSRENPVILQKILNNMGVIPGTGRNKGMLDVTPIAYLESTIPDLSRVNDIKETEE